jgi:hypothetical protein
MNKYFQIALIISVALLVYIGCTDNHISDLPSHLYRANIYIRNTSTLSGVTLTVPPAYYQAGYPAGWAGGFSVYLNPSPQVGIPVESSGWVLCPAIFDWSAERAIDTVIFDSGSIYIDSDKWVVIYGDSTGWNCVWYNSAW